jgi:hypothetical protein
MAPQNYIKRSVFPNLWCRENRDFRAKTDLEMLIFFVLSLPSKWRRLAVLVGNKTSFIHSLAQSLHYEDWRKYGKTLANKFEINT